jgi:hypothetical protein
MYVYTSVHVCVYPEAVPEDELLTIAATTWALIAAAFAATHIR